VQTFTFQKELFKKNPIIEVEIGCGNGHFISHYAETNKDKYLIGIEFKEKRFIKASKKINKRNLNNVILFKNRAEIILESIPPLSVDVFHIYFPDPWPKARHRKRRFLRMQNVKMLYSALKLGGKIYFMTDFFDYYIQTKILLLTHPGFSLRLNSFPDDALISIYGKKFKNSDKEIYKLSVEKIRFKDQFD